MRAGRGKRTAATGGVIGFLGIAGPVCNRILKLLLGSALRLKRFELAPSPALGGVVLLDVAIWPKLTGRGRSCCTVKVSQPLVVEIIANAMALY